MEQNSSLSISYAVLASLKLNPKNPHLPSESQIRLIAHSIQAYGFNIPILVDRNLNVIDGRERVLAARLLELDRVPIIRLDHLSEHQQQGLLIADNHLFENSEEDERPQGEELIGYGKPPAKTRFKKGMSGNPKGRPKSRPTIGSILFKELAKKLPVPQKGTRKSIQMMNAILMVVTNKAMRGDLGALKLIMGIMEREEKVRIQQHIPEPSDKCRLEKPLTREEAERSLRELGVRVVRIPNTDEQKTDRESNNASSEDIVEPIRKLKT